MRKNTLDVNLVRGELARRGLRQLDIANSLGLPLSTFSGYLHGMYPAPEDFAAKVERLLEVPAGALSSEGAR
jgi:predicted transcriptional regulator